MGQTQGSGFSEAGLVGGIEQLKPCTGTKPISPKGILTNVAVEDGENQLPEEVKMPEDVEVIEPEMEAGEVRPVVRRAAHDPTAEEVRRHKVNHTPYRSWCPECVKGRAKDSFHRKAKEEEKAVPTMHLDYWFMRDRQGAELVPVATMKDDISKTFKAHIVPGKGNVKGVAQMLVKDIEKMGYTGVVNIKCDQEAALMDLTKEMARIRPRTIVEYSRAKDSKSNGVAERAVQSIEGMTRTFKFALEKRLGIQIPSAHPVMGWLIEHAAETLNRYHVGQDGRTPYERVKGKAYKGEMVEFAQKVFHRHPGKTSGGSMEERWTEGIWLGKTARSDEHIIALDNGKIVKAGAIVTRPERESWCSADVMNIKKAPNVAGEPREAIRPAGVVPEPQVDHRAHSRAEQRDHGVQGVPADQPEQVQGVQLEGGESEKDGPEIDDPVPRERGPVDIYIRTEDIKKYGYSKSCPKCRAMQLGDVTKSRASHSKECRARIRTSMVNDKVMRKKVEDAEKRRDEYLARRIEEEMNDKDHKRPRIEVENMTDEQLSPTTQGESSKRGREGHDAEEANRPTQYQTVGEVAQVPVPDGYDASEDVPMVGETVLNACYTTPLRGGKKVNKYDVCEAFSPPRTCARARQRGMRGGWSLDCSTTDPITGREWDLRDPETQKRVVAMLYRDRPSLLVVCPPSTLFSKLQNLSGDPSTRSPRAWAEAVEMVNFAVKLCRIQSVDGRKFLFEHPLGATSWKRTTLREFMNEAGVSRVTGHMCAYGMTMHDQLGEGKVMKPMGYLTNSVVLGEKLSRTCTGDHRHVHLVQGWAAAAAKYPEGLMDAILDAVDIECKSKIFSFEVTNKQKEELDELHDEIEIDWSYVDDVTGKELDREKVAEARTMEMKTFHDMNVYEHVTREEMNNDEGIKKKIGVRWVDVEKADGTVRSRLVAQEFAKGQNRDDLFAGTPPLSATKFVLSELASEGEEGPGSKRIAIMDIKRAFLYGDIRERIYIDLPIEDPMREKGMMGRLVKAMYGTRAAPVVWQGLVQDTMRTLGFSMSSKFPCLYHHALKDVKVVTHVDDFICTGEKSELQWLRRELEKKFELKGEIMGPGPGEVKMSKFLGRTIEWRKGGICYKGDENHTKVLLEEWLMDESKPVTTPGVPEEKNIEQDGAENQKLDSNGTREYRRAAARLNYMALDRPDIGFAAKEASRAMSSPCEGDRIRLKRILRYLKGVPSVELWYGWQRRSEVLVAYCDSDWAGCKRTRKSTSGGVILNGQHCLHHWSSTQATIALSVGEAELNASIKASVEAIGMRDMSRDVGLVRRCEVRSDSSAAKGIAQRQGCGKLKHLSTKQLWIQTAVASRAVDFQKIPREQNPSDALTHHWTGVEGAKHFPNIGINVATVGGARRE